MAGWKDISSLFVMRDESEDAGGEERASPEDIERMLATVRAETGQTKPASGAPAKVGAPPLPSPPASNAAKPPPAKAAVTAPAIVEGKSFDSLYSEARVPSSPYPAERLLKLIEGLQAMEAATRATVVAALDQADDSWTIADPVLDAQRKIEVLNGAKAAHGEALKQVEAGAAADGQAQDKYLADASAEIRKQIAELQKMLEGEVATVTARKTEIDGRVRSARETVTREIARLDTEIARLSVLQRTFTPDSKRH